MIDLAAGYGSPRLFFGLDRRMGPECEPITPRTREERLDIGTSAIAPIALHLSAEMLRCPDRALRWRRRLRAKLQVLDTTLSRATQLACLAYVGSVPGVGRHPHALTAPQLHE